jgi:hypothetical protein
MFPSHDAVVTAVPEYERYPLLDELETSTHAFAAAHPGVEVWPAGASETVRGPDRSVMRLAGTDEATGVS